ncbi:hypothetical protein DND66_20305 [Escherichia coli]|nr:hypothetical protein [Escherichia coli]
MKTQGIYFMKKTLIALAVAASAAVSGSAMAWSQQDSAFNGNIELGGTLSPEVKKLPWELQIGTGSSQLNGTIAKGNREATLTINDAIPVLGMRNVNGGFKGEAGLTPQVSYNGKVDVDTFNAGTATMNLDVTNKSGARIGSLSVDFSAAAYGANNTNRASLYAGSAGYAFWGGVAKSAGGAVNSVSDVENLAVSFFPNILDTKGDMSGLRNLNPHQFKFDSAESTYRAIYSSGISAGKNISISLDDPATTDRIEWRASLPVTVSYQ